jgi:PHS family inorganic phosphate transporter-like MFS transporter
MNLPGIIDTSVKASGIIGVIFGQLVFGILGDRLGRTRMYGLVLAIMIIGTFTSSFSASTVSGLNVFGVLIIWRIVLGIGIGGDFPLSAIITSEYANKRYRGAMIAGVFSMQGAGILAQGFVTLISLVAFKSAIQRDESNLDYVWRIALGMGTLPGLLAIFWRLNLPETPRYTLEVDNDYERAAVDVDFVFNPKLKRNISVKRVGENRPSVKDLVTFFKRKRNFKLLLGTSIPRFALNVAFYGINLNSSIILHSIGFGVSSDIYTTIFNNAVGQIVIALLGSIPGYM